MYPSGPSLQDSSDSTSAAMLGICVCQKICRHITVPEIVDVKMQHLAKLERHQQLYCTAKCVDAKWVAM